MISNIKKITLVISLLSLITNYYKGQGIGINTVNPIGILHTDGAKDNPTTGNNFSTNQQLNDVIITKDGKLGAGNISPNSKLDLRNAANGAIGIGNTTLTANYLGEGAIRYNNGIEYSNGQSWNKILPNLPSNKVLVIATKTNNSVKLGTPTASVNNGLQNRRSNYLVEWNKIFESNNASTFNATTGVFTAPRDAVYVVVYTINLQAIQFNFDAATTNNPLQTEAIWQLYDNTTNFDSNNIVNTVKCVNNYSSNTTNNATLDSGSYCTASIYMRQGQRLIPYVWFNLNASNASNFSLNTTGGYNNLTISEQ